MSRPRAARDNLVPPIIAAVEARATVGEIADTLRGVFGEYRGRRAGGCLTVLLSVEGLTTRFDTPAGRSTAVDDVSFEIRQGETLGLVGESGSGKSVTAFSIIRLVQPPGRVTAGGSLFQGRDLLALPEEEMRQVRGAGIGFVFQEPMAALNPVMRVGEHIAEALRVHGLATARKRAPARSSCCARCGSPTPSNAWTTTRISCRAACASA